MYCVIKFSSSGKTIMILTDITLIIIISIGQYRRPILSDFPTEHSYTAPKLPSSPSVFFTFSMWSWWCRTLSGCSRWPEPRSPRLLSGCHGRFCPAGVSSGAVVRRGRVSVDKANIDQHRGKSKSARTAAIPKVVRFISLKHVRIRLQRLNEFCH